MLLFWIMPTLFLPAFQTKLSDSNCLRANPDTLDADFTLYNKYKNQLHLTAEDIAKQFVLFRTRFSQGHELRQLYSEELKLIRDAVSLYKSSSNENIYLFLKGAGDYGHGVDVNLMVRLYKADHETLKFSNSGDEGLHFEMYSPGLMNSFEEELVAMETAFGLKENATMKTGHEFLDYFAAFVNKSAAEYLRRLHFIRCAIHPEKKPTPEDAADEVIGICHELKNIAVSNKLLAEIMCSVEFPAYGTSSNGVVGSVFDFQKFWCRIIDTVTQPNFSAKIIMVSAIDNAPLISYKFDDGYALKGYYHSGWWRRRDARSYEASAFVEKVEELKGGREHKGCGAECSFCNSSSGCCEGGFCFPDSAFQPFEMGPPRKVCQSIETICAPRPPMKLTAPAVYKTTSTLATMEKPSKLTMPIISGLDAVHVTQQTRKFNEASTVSSTSGFTITSTAHVKPLHTEGSSATTVESILRNTGETIPVNITAYLLFSNIAFIICHLSI